MVRLSPAVDASRVPSMVKGLPLATFTVAPAAFMVSVPLPVTLRPPAKLAPAALVPMLSVPLVTWATWVGSVAATARAEAEVARVPLSILSAPLTVALPVRLKVAPPPTPE